MFTKPKKFQISRNIGAVSYLECSAYAQDGLREVFKEAAVFAITGGNQEGAKRERASICTLI